MSPDHAFDPLASLRRADDPEVDVFVQGTVFLDIIFTGLKAMPKSGTEVWADGMGSCPGGIANLAVAASRMGLKTSLGAAFGDDDYGDFCWRSLADQEGVDLSRSQRYPHWHTPVTVSVSVGGDRRMITHGHDAPQNATEMIGKAPTARSVLLDLDAERPLGQGHREREWADLAAAEGALLFADVGWDPTEAWAVSMLDQLEHCHAFMPNVVEAMAYTRTDSAHDALYALADLVPLAVVTNGRDGAVAIDSATGEEASVPALRVEAIDPTGAGDVFDAGMLVGTLAGWPLLDRMNFATLCSSLAVQEFGGSLAAPGWGDISDWWHRVRSQPTSNAAARSVQRRFAFLDELVAEVPSGAVRRAAATIAKLSDAQAAGIPPTEESP
ncbi:sugar kinase [Knoellia sinensis KCTC 19936]|uniref:Sugar kinase n=1 Tax=Knoellia sinensis KCTC 19936 TaxID=1385520 RepID=A0A0A0JFK8_9MICO|nr:carbohydrate kinase family protein [Knoellia sinensis]KGN34862.1 sugar kinase [Knoellia sinensis KCTC 19936]